MGFFRRFGWVGCIVLVLQGGCASELPALPDEGTSSGESSASGGESTAALDTSGGETEDSGIEPGCGNGIIEAGETCDEQGQAPTCDEDCTPVDCGDGLVNEAAGEECDEGEATETCNLDCTLPWCGDGVINAKGEQCDDGVASVFCDEDCTVIECGDGVLNTLAGESCDEAGKSATCDEDCTVVQCGDALVNVLAHESCDGIELAGGTCEGLGFGLGTLACNNVCGYETSGCTPATPTLDLNLSPIKWFDFSWVAVQGAEYYQVLERPALGEPYEQLGGDVIGEFVSFEMPLHFRWQASYVLRACNLAGCTDSVAVGVVGSLAEAVGYIKPSNTGVGDLFGISVALSGDGNTLAVGADWEDSNGTGVGGNQANNSASSSGAVYVFVRNGAGAWSQQAYVKASNTGASDRFGYRVALSGDGNTLAVGAHGEDGNDTGVGGVNQGDNSASSSGAVYVFARYVGAWSQQSYVKASNTGANDLFGISVVLSGDGNTLAVGAYGEASNATGQADNSAIASGAVYVFVRDGAGAWSQQAYVKASNTGAGDQFGISVALSGNGNTLAVGANNESSNAMGVGGNQADESAPGSGAVYVFVRDGAGAWSQQAYVKASNTGPDDEFGISVALSGDGNTLAVSAYLEDSNAMGVGSDQADDSAGYSGAVYVFVQDGAGVWSQQAYIKASNTGADEQFGTSVALSGDGDILAVGTPYEGSSAIGIEGDQADETAPGSGAVYVFMRDGTGAWSQQSYVKASNTGVGDSFGISVALSGDGNTLAVGAVGEDSNSIGIGGNLADDSEPESGAVYLY